LLKDLKVTDFLEETASGTPAPGGGSVAALSAALAAALSEMVANLTIGKKGYGDREKDMKALAEKARSLRQKLTGDIDRDSDAYAEVMTAFRMPNQSEEEKIRRRQAVQRGLKTAASVPLSVAKDAIRVMELAGIAIEKGNPNTVTDGAVAALAARSAVLSALYNVKINIDTIADEDFKDDMKTQVEELEAEVIEKEKEVLAKLII